MSADFTRTLKSRVSPPWDGAEGGRGFTAIVWNTTMGLIGVLFGEPFAFIPELVILCSGRRRLRARLRNVYIYIYVSRT